MEVITARHPFQFRLRTIFIFLTVASLPFPWIAAEVKRRIALEQAASLKEQQKAQEAADLKRKQQQAALWARAAYDKGVSDVKAALEDGSIHILASRLTSKFCGEPPEDQQWYIEWRARQRAISDHLPKNVLYCITDICYAQKQLLDKDAKIVTLGPRLGLEIFFTSRKLRDEDLQYLTRPYFGSTITSLDLLEQMAVTDAGIKYLRHLHELRRLNVKGTGITEAGIQRLKEIFPYCEMEH